MTELTVYDSIEDGLVKFYFKDINRKPENITVTFANFMENTDEEVIIASTEQNETVSVYTIGDEITEKILGTLLDTDSYIIETPEGRVKKQLQNPEKLRNLLE